MGTLSTIRRIYPPVFRFVASCGALAAAGVALRYAAFGDVYGAAVYLAIFMISWSIGGDLTQPRSMQR